MNNKTVFPVFILLAALLACGIPGSSPVQPTVNALPPTPNLPVSVSSPVAPAPTVSNDAGTTFSNTVREEFDGRLSPGIGWTWLRQDNSTWSLTATPGWLRINLSTSSYLTGLPSNVLTTPAPQGDFDMRTWVRFAPTQNFELAGLLILFDERVVLQFGRGFCNASLCVGGGFYFDNLQNGTAAGGILGTPASSDQSLLRIVRQGSLYTAYYQVDNVNWVMVGSHTMDRQPVSIGLIAAQAQAAGSYAEFDWFEIAQP